MYMPSAKLNNSYSPTASPKNTNYSDYLHFSSEEARKVKISTLLYFWNIKNISAREKTMYVFPFLTYGGYHE